MKQRSATAKRKFWRQREEANPQNKSKSAQRTGEAERDRPQLGRHAFGNVALDVVVQTRLHAFGT